MATAQGYLLAPSGGNEQPVVGIFVGLYNTQTSTGYAATVATDANGFWSISNVPQGGNYTLYTSATGTGVPPAAGWNVSSLTNLIIPFTAGDLTFRNAVRALSNANVGSRSGPQTVDGYSAVAGDRVLLTAQSTASQNGVWVVQSGAWTRPVDFFTGMDGAGSVVFVEGGTTYTGQLWGIATTGLVTIDTTAQTWTVISSGAGGGGASTNTTQQFVDRTTTLTSGSTFNGTGRDLGNNPSAGSGYSRFRAFAVADQVGTLWIDQSNDNATWYGTRSTPVAINVAMVMESIPTMRYVRVRFINGPTNQGSFLLCSCIVAV